MVQEPYALPHWKLCATHLVLNDNPMAQEIRWDLKVLAEPQLVVQSGHSRLLSLLILLFVWSSHIKVWILDEGTSLPAAVLSSSPWFVSVAVNGGSIFSVIPSSSISLPSPCSYGERDCSLSTRTVLENLHTDNTMCMANKRIKLSVCYVSKWRVWHLIDLSWVLWLCSSLVRTLKAGTSIGKDKLPTKLLQKLLKTTCDRYVLHINKRLLWFLGYHIVKKAC